MITKHELENYELRHKAGGNGLYWLCDLGDDICKVGYVSKDGVERALLASTALLSVEMVQKCKPTEDEPNPPMIPKSIPPQERNHINKARIQLASGKLAVVNQRLVPA